MEATAGQPDPAPTTASTPTPSTTPPATPPTTTATPATTTSTTASCAAPGDAAPRRGGERRRRRAAVRPRERRAAPTCQSAHAAPRWRTRKPLDPSDEMLDAPKGPWPFSVGGLCSGAGHHNIRPCKDLVTKLDSDLLPKGAIFHGRYQVFLRIGRGGMGEVYEVRDLSTRKARALKVMLPDFVADPGLRARFEQEARITADIDSEHIVEITDAGTDADTGFPFIAMELLKGEDLGRIVREKGALEPEQVLTLLRQVSDVLDRTHEAGIVHRDLKPENLFLAHRNDGSPRIKVLDFGIAKLIATSLSSARTTATIGTPLYMAPEQFRGDGTVDARADIYALGHIAFSLLVGVPYWAPESANVGAMMRLVEMPLPESASARARALRGVALQAPFDAWFSKATSASPPMRFDTASESVDSLAIALGFGKARGVHQRSAFEAGQVFRGRYRVEEMIGQGGMGEVYEVLDLVTNRRRALKLMRERNIGDADLRRRFLAEAKITAGIESRHLVEVVDAADDPATVDPFLVMELLRGETLGARLQRTGGLPPAEAVSLLRQAAECLSRTHAAGVIHRDLKPENLFLVRCEDGSPILKIIDFGLAKVLADAPSVATNALGTLLYMAPEQFSTTSKIDHRIDIYSLGQIGFTMLVGVPYWEPEASEASNMFQILYRITSGPREEAVLRAARLRDVRLPAAIDAWFSKATAPDPAERFPSATALADAFADALGQASPPPDRPVVVPATPLSLGYSTTLPESAPSPTVAANPPIPENQTATIKLPDRHALPTPRLAIEQSPPGPLPAPTVDHATAVALLEASRPEGERVSPEQGAIQASSMDASSARQGTWRPPVGLVVAISGGFALAVLGTWYIGARPPESELAALTASAQHPPSSMLTAQPTALASGPTTPRLVNTGIAAREEPASSSAPTGVAPPPASSIVRPAKTAKPAGVGTGPIGTKVR